MANVRLTERRIRDARHDRTKTSFLWDLAVPGFGIRSTPSGTQSFVLWVRSGGKKSLLTLGRVSAISLDQARKSAASELNQIDRGGDDLLARRAKRREGLTVAQGAEWYLDVYIPKRQGLRKMGERTATEYRRQLHACIIPSIGHLLIKAVDRKDIEKMLDSRIGWKKPAMYGRVRALVRALFNAFAVQGWRHEGSNPATRIAVPTERERTRTLSPDEQAALLAALARLGDHPAVAAIRFMDATGCRLNEARTLQWDFVDHERRVIDLPDTKTGAKKIRATNEVMGILSGCPRIADNGYVFPGSRADAPMGERAIRIMFHRAAALAGISGVKPHDLRRTFITDAINAGVPLPTVADLVGHKTLSMTFRYSQASDRQVRDGAEVLAAARKARRGADVIAPEFGGARA